jgi:hypothetical protein
MSYSFFENTERGYFMYEEPFFLNSYENEPNDFFYNREDDKKYFQEKDIFNNYANFKFEERTEETDKNLINNSPKNDLQKNEIVPSYYSLGSIKELINKNDDNYRCNEIIGKIINDKTVLETAEYLNSTKKITIDNYMFPSDNIFKQENFFDFGYEVKNNYLKKKRGRKSERNDGEEHDRFYADNIIKKIKAKLFDYCLIFINKIIYTNDEEGIQLLKNDYKYIDQLNRKKNLDLFEMTLMDLFSLEISGKYKSKSKDYNEKMIKEIVQQKFDREDYDTIMFLFRISLNDYIDLFTYKKDIFEVMDKYNAINVNYSKIKENFIGANHLLSEISKKNDEKYYTLFLLYTFNFQRWFYIKKGRNRKSKGAYYQENLFK